MAVNLQLFLQILVAIMILLEFL
ncbi:MULTISPECIES: hypothetical protein [Bacillaceae]|nr:MULTISPECIES: hypothetical protein [Priestia]MCG0050096.1 hypothetical protein [Priestia aryabhattai]